MRRDDHFRVLFYRLRGPQGRRNVLVKHVLERCSLHEAVRLVQTSRPAGVLRHESRELTIPPSNMSTGAVFEFNAVADIIVDVGASAIKFEAGQEKSA